MRIVVSAVVGACAVAAFFGVLGASSPSKGPAAPRYQFLPARQNLWAVDQAKSQIMFFKFPDREDSPVKRSKAFDIDRELFPEGKVKFILSEREVTSVLWLVNEETGQVQVVRYQRDGTVGTPFKLDVSRQFE